MERNIIIIDGPPGNLGFRSGNWKVSIDGVERNFFASVPHNIPLDKQDEIVREKVLRFIKREKES